MGKEGREGTFIMCLTNRPPEGCRSQALWANTGYDFTIKMHELCPQLTRLELNMLECFRDWTVCSEDADGD